MNEGFLKILFIILCFQLLFVSFFLFQSKKSRALSNKLLAVVFCMLAFSLISLYCVVFGVDLSFPPLLFVDDTFLFAYGPLLFLFTRSVLFKDFSLGLKSLLHLSPFFLSVCFLIGLVIFVDSASMAETIGKMKSGSVPVFLWVGNVLLLLYALFYLFISKREAQRVFTTTADKYSSFNPVEFRMLNFILNSFFVLFCISLLHAILPLLGFSGGLAITLILLVLFAFYFINSALFRMLKQSTNSGGLVEKNVLTPQKKYAGSDMTATQLEENKTRLWEYMVATKKFLDSELTIDDLAKDVALPSKTLSQVINEGFSCNFFDFVNRFRVEEAKSFFVDQTDDKMTIQEVMYLSGFNSKSSFNTAFRKFTGKTPTQFKNSL